MWRASVWRIYLGGLYIVGVDVNRLKNVFTSDIYSSCLFTFIYFGSHYFYKGVFPELLDVITLGAIFLFVSLMWKYISREHNKRDVCRRSRFVK